MRAPPQSGLVIAEGQGTSMFPFSPPGTILFFEPSDRYQVGDVVLFESGGRDVAHRVVKATAGRIVTWGDWNTFPDPDLRPESVRGKCTVMMRKGSPVYMHWPAMRLFNLALATVLPTAKTVLRPLLVRLRSSQSPESPPGV